MIRSLNNHGDRYRIGNMAMSNKIVPMSANNIPTEIVTIASPMAALSWDGSAIPVDLKMAVDARTNLIVASARIEAAGICINSPLIANQ